jgi:putative flippase GtrA
VRPDRDHHVQTGTGRRAELLPLGAQKWAPLALQFLWYLPVGATAFLADLAGFVLLTNAGMAPVPAAAVGVLIGAVVNYILSVLLAFRRGRFGAVPETLRFVAVALVGLALTTLLVKVFVDAFALEPLLAKALAVVIVLAWNFLARRLFVFSGELPVATDTLTRQTLAALRPDRVAGASTRDGRR